MLMVVPVVPDLFERLHRLEEATRRRVLSQRLIETTAVDDEQDGGRHVENLYPLPPLSLLSADVKDAAITSVVTTVTRSTSTTNRWRKQTHNYDNIN